MLLLVSYLIGNVLYKKHDLIGSSLDSMSEKLLITHNWYQLKTFFESIGYHQVPSQTADVPETFLYFMNDKRHTIGFEKSNKISLYAVRRILARVDFTYEYFVMVFYGSKNESASS